MLLAFGYGLNEGSSRSPLNRCTMKIAFKLFVLVTVTSLSYQGFAAEIPTATPEDVGMSSAKLSKIDGVMTGLIKESKFAGGTVIVAKDGHVVHFKSYGVKDLETKAPMTNETIMRFYSMNKAITSAAIMILVDDGKVDLDAPAAKYIDSFRKLKVYEDGDVIPPPRPMTVRDLLRHTAGLTYGRRAGSPVDKHYQKLNALNRNEDLKAMCDKLGQIPLEYSPGTAWMYSCSIDVLGRIVEVASGKSFDEFLSKRIFDPLDMKDTGFHVPANKLGRFATCYNSDGKGKLTLRDPADEKSRFAKKPAWLSGGGGLVSTGRDYLRFLMMVANGGRLGDTRVLSQKAVQQMTSNQLPKEAGWVRFGSQNRVGVGFGLGFSVRVKMSDWDPQSRVGEYGWGGAASTHYWVSPKDNLIVITLEQTCPFTFLTEFALKGLIYDAIEK